MKSRIIQQKRKLWIIAIPIILILVYLIYDAYSQPSLKDIPGDFEQVAFVRNEQNKGGVIRIYAVTTGDVVNAKYDLAADLFPTNEINSITRIYFFDKSKPYPTTISLDPPYYDTTKYDAIQIIKRSGSK